MNGVRVTTEGRGEACTHATPKPNGTVKAIVAWETVFCALTSIELAIFEVAMIYAARELANLATACASCASHGALRIQVSLRHASHPPSRGSDHRHFTRLSDAATAETSTICQVRKATTSTSDSSCRAAMDKSAALHLSIILCNRHSDCDHRPRGLEAL